MQVQGDLVVRLPSAVAALARRVALAVLVTRAVMIVVSEAASAAAAAVLA
jgi:hypothetical protein